MDKAKTKRTSLMLNTPNVWMMLTPFRAPKIPPYTKTKYFFSPKRASSRKGVKGMNGNKVDIYARKHKSAGFFLETSIQVGPGLGL